MCDLKEYDITYEQYLEEFNNKREKVVNSSGNDFYETIEDLKFFIDKYKKYEQIRAEQIDKDGM